MNNLHCCPTDAAAVERPIFLESGLGHPLISVVIATYNMGQYLSDAIHGVLNQSYDNIEIIVVDDGSSDGTPDVLAGFGGRITALRQDNAGQSTARNRAILRSRGHYIAFLDADDVWAPEKIARQVEQMGRHPDAVLCYTDFSRSPDARPGGESALRGYDRMATGWAFDNLLWENWIHTSSVLVRRDALALAGLFESGLHGGEDRDLWLRLARLGEITCVGEILVYVRRHAGNITNTIDFYRQLIRANRMYLARWGEDPLSRRVIRSNLRRLHWDLACYEWFEGNIPEARNAYFHSAVQGHRIVSSLSRAAFASLPRSLIAFLSPKFRRDGESRDPESPTRRHGENGG